MRKVLIGEGGCSRVYRIWIEATQGFIVEKRSSFPLAWEAIWMKKLQGFAVPKFYGVRKENSYWIISMEYLHGKTLDRWIKDNPGDKKKAYAILRNMIKELERIRGHYPDIALCDLKPANIIVNRNQTIHFIDFDAVSTVNVKKVCHGTKPYAAPEIILGCPGKKSDVYSLGQIIWQMRGWKKDFLYYRVIAPCIMESEELRQGDLSWLQTQLDRYEKIEDGIGILKEMIHILLMFFSLFVVLLFGIWFLKKICVIM